MAKNLVEQLKELDPYTNHMKDALGKVNGRNELAWS